MTATIHVSLHFSHAPMASMALCSDINYTPANKDRFIEDVMDVLGGKDVHTFDVFASKKLSCSVICLLSQITGALKRFKSSFALPSFISTPLKKCTVRIPRPGHPLRSGAAYTIKHPDDVKRVISSVKKERLALFGQTTSTLSYDQSRIRSFTPELEKTFLALGELEAGWNGEACSVPASQHLLNLFRETLIILPAQFDFPEVYTAGDGSLEFVWPDARFYGSLDDETLELEWVGKTQSLSFETKNTGDASVLCAFICAQLQAAFDRESESGAGLSD